MAKQKWEAAILLMLVCLATFDLSKLLHYCGQVALNLTVGVSQFKHIYFSIWLHQHEDIAHIDVPFLLYGHLNLAPMKG